LSRRAVDEKDEVVLGVRGARHCGVGVRKAVALKGRKTGRKAERFMVGGWRAAGYGRWMCRGRLVRDDLLWKSECQGAKGVGESTEGRWRCVTEMGYFY
jgi:hypothetical protein